MYIHTSTCSKHKQYHDIDLTDIIGIYWVNSLILRSIEAVFLYIVRQLHIGQYGQNIQILLLLTTTALQQHIITLYDCKMFVVI